MQSALADLVEDSIDVAGHARSGANGEAAPLATVVVRGGVNASEEVEESVQMVRMTNEIEARDRSAEVPRLAPGVVSAGQEGDEREGNHRIGERRQAHRQHEHEKDLCVRRKERSGHDDAENTRRGADQRRERTVEQQSRNLDIGSGHHGRDPPSDVQKAIHQRAEDSTKEIERQISLPAQVTFNHRSEEVQADHVEQQMHEACMQELEADQAPELDVQESALR